MINRLNELREHGRLQWVRGENGWIARPDDVVDALAQHGYQEYKREIACTTRDRAPTGGVWQGLDTTTGSIASAIWVTRDHPDAAIVFIEIDGEPLRGDQ
jgi:hypothetical protein